MSESGEEDPELEEPAEDGSDAEPAEDGSGEDPAEDEEEPEPEEPPEPFSELKDMIGNAIAEQISSLKDIQSLHGAHHHFKPVVIDEESSEQPEHIHNHHHFMHFNSDGDFHFKSGPVGMFKLGPDIDDHSEESEEQKVDRTGEFTANQLFIGGTLIASFAYMICVLQRG